jgi:hypothetical protein
LSHCLLLSKYASSANIQISQIIAGAIGQLIIVNQTRLSEMYLEAAIRPQAEHSLARFLAQMFTLLGVGSSQKRRPGRADKPHKLNGGALVEAWQVVEGPSILIKVVLFSYLGYFFQPRP